MSKIIQCTVGLAVVVALVLAAIGAVLFVATFAPWLIIIMAFGWPLFFFRESICLLGETVLTLAKAIWSKP